MDPKTFSPGIPEHIYPAIGAIPSLEKSSRAAPQDPAVNGCRLTWSGRSCRETTRPLAVPRIGASVEGT